MILYLLIPPLAPTASGLNKTSDTILLVKRIFRFALVIILVVALLLGLVFISKKKNIQIPLLNNSTTVSYELLAKNGGVDENDLPGEVKQTGAMVLDQPTFQGMIDNFAKTGNLTDSLKNLKPDFSGHSIVLLVQREDAGNNLEIKSVTVNSQHATVHILRNTIGSGCIGLPSFSTRFLLVSLPKNISSVSQQIKTVEGEPCKDF